MVYFVFGFAPTMFGFALGLLLQCVLFEPQDMLHLGVNALSLIVPLIAAHTLVGRRILAAAGTAPIAWASVLKFDAIYYGGYEVEAGLIVRQAREQGFKAAMISGDALMTCAPPRCRNAAIGAAVRRQTSR